MGKTIEKLLKDVKFEYDSISNELNCYAKLVRDIEMVLSNQTCSNKELAIKKLIDECKYPVPF